LIVDDIYRGGNVDGGEGSTGVKGILVYESHGCRDSDRGEGVVVLKGSNTDAIQGCREGD